MNLTITSAPRSSLKLAIELPPEKLNEAILDAVRRLSRRTRVAGFRPGKAPRVMLERVLGPDAVMEEAVEHLVSDAYRQAIRDLPILPLDSPSVDFADRQPVEGQPVAFTRNRPGPADRPTRRLSQFQLLARDRDHRRREGRQGPRGAARPELDPRAGRGPRRREGRLRRRRLRRNARRRAVRGRQRPSGCPSSWAMTD